MASKEKPTRRGKRSEGNPLAELESILNGAAKGPADKTSGTQPESMALPQKVTHGRLADGATWEENEKGEIVIKRIKKEGLMGDKTKEITYSATIPEFNEISRQKESGVAISKPMESVSASAPKVIAIPPAEQTSEISPEAARLEAEEQREIEKKVDERIAAKQTPTVPAVETVESKAIPPELEKMYGGKVPSGVLEMYEKLKGKKKREDYLAKLAVKEKERKEKEERRNARKAATASKDHTESMEIKPPQSHEVAKDQRANEVDATVETSSDGRIEPTLGTEPEQVADISQKPEGTPKEWREKLRELIEGAKEKTKEKVEWWKSAEENLIRRSTELDAQAEKINGGERIFRWAGEQYNKMGWKTKLVIGIGLGVGYGAALSAVSVPGIIGFVGLIGAQRAAGLATMYLKYEKTRPHEVPRDEKFWQWGSREKAMMKSILYTAAMTAGMAYAAKEISDHDLIHRTKEWLGGMLGHQATAPETPAPKSAPSLVQPSAPASEVAPTPEADSAITSPEVTVSAPSEVAESSAAVSAADEAVVASAPEAPVTPEMPSISVEATKGRGYEYMMKRMWEQLQEKGLDASQYSEGSDIRRLLEADANSIDKVVHQIAADPERGYFNPDGISARIGLGSQMTVNAEGNIELDGVVKASEGAYMSIQEESAPITEPPPAPPLEQMNMDASAPEPVQTIEAPEYPLETASLAPEAPTFVTKLDGVVIDPEVPAIYEAQTPAGEKILVAYGGSDQERFNFIQDYLMRPENQDKSIRFAHEVSSLLGSQIKVDTIGAQTTEGGISWFLDFFRSPVEPPSPETFLRQLSK